MNKTISIIRISILIALALVAFVGIFSEPTAENNGAWFLDFFLSKGIGAAACYGIYKLYTKWVKVDAWLAAYDKWSEYDEEQDAPNPMRLD